MSGEWSKNVGETGERTVKRLLDQLGWTPLIQNYDVPCKFPEDHKTGPTKSHRREHGLDGSFQYMCPLVDATQQHVVVSVKYGADRYPMEGALGRTFGAHYRSLAQMCVCYGKSEGFGTLTAASEGAARFPVCGVLFWLTNDSKDDEASICPGLTTIRAEADPIPVSLVDNNQAAFLSDSIAFVRRNFGDSFAFNYQATGKNLDSRTRQHKGSILPLQMLNSSEMVFRVEASEKMLVICSKNAFSEADLKRLCDLAQYLSQGWPAKIVVAFRSFDELRQGQTANRVKQMFAGNDGLKNLQVSPLTPSFRTEDLK